MKPYIKNENIIYLCKDFKISIIIRDNYFVVRNGYHNCFYFNHFENAVFCALSLFYDGLTVSMDELPLIDIMEDFNKLENIFCVGSEEQKNA